LTLGEIDFGPSTSAVGEILLIQRWMVRLLAVWLSELAFDPKRSGLVTIENHIDVGRSAPEAMSELLLEAKPLRPDGSS